MTAAATWLREAAADGLVHLFGTGHSRIPGEEMSPRVGSCPGFNPDRAQADAMVTIGGVDTPIGPGSTIGAVAIVSTIKVRTAEVLVARGSMPPVITRASVVGTERSRTLFNEAYREHARRLARAIDLQGGE